MSFQPMADAIWTYGPTEQSVIRIFTTREAAQLALDIMRFSHPDLVFDDLEVAEYARIGADEVFRVPF